jgi:hypothetical protein
VHHQRLEVVEEGAFQAVHDGTEIAKDAQEGQFESIRFGLGFYLVFRDLIDLT